MDSLKKSTRENNYDLLRIICSIAVIIIHVSGMYKNSLSDISVFGEIYTLYTTTILAYNTLSHFAVPCFIMLSGAFLLSDERNIEYHYFYKKSMLSIGIPTIIFTILYFLFSEIIAFSKFITYSSELTELITPIKDTLKGAPFYHMWYLYTSLGLYLITPALLKLKNDIGEHSFTKLSYIIFIVSTISGWTSSHSFHWSIAKTACYLGYFLIGYQIKKFANNKKNTLIGTSLITLGLSIGIIATYIRYFFPTHILSNYNKPYSNIENFNPLIVIISVLIFMGFSKLHIKHNYAKLSSKTLYIYLFHAGIWSLISNLFIRKIALETDCRIIIPIFVLIVFLLSYICSCVYASIWKLIVNKFKVTDIICKLFKLN